MVSSILLLVQILTTITIILGAVSTVDSGPDLIDLSTPQEVVLPDHLVEIL
jgi:hypothetical protein